MKSKEEVEYLTRSQLRPFRYNPYLIKQDEDMANLVKSIKEYGIISPIIVRKVSKKDYEILSGHRRFKACQLLDLKEIPVIVKDIKMPEAAIYVVDSNLQRENLLVSEKSFAYKLKYDALKHQGKLQDDLTSCQLGTKYKTDSANLIAKQEGTSRRQIFRYIHLTLLNKELLKMVDDKRIAFNPAVELSYLNDKEQKILVEAIEEMDATPSFSQAQYLRKLSKEGKFTANKVYSTLEDPKPNQKEKLKLDIQELQDFFPRGTTPKEMEKIIMKLLEENAPELSIDKDEIDFKI